MPSGTVVIADCDHGTVEPERRLIEAADELKTTVAREALRVLAGERPLAPVNEPAATS